MAVQEAAALLGFAPALRMEGLIDVDVPPEIADHALAVLREDLSNVVQHARATTAEVSLVVVDGELTLTVTDDGIGIPEGGHRSGLRNLEERATGLGGDMTAEAAVGGGTQVIWRVPLRAR